MATKGKKSSIKIDPSKKGTFESVVGTKKNGNVKKTNADKIMSAKKDPKTGKYPKVTIDGEKVQVTPELKKKAVFYENIALKKKSKKK